MLSSPIVYPAGPQTLGLEDSVVRQLRLITAFMLLAIGGINIGLGILRKKQLRVMRGQAKPPDDGKDKPKDKNAEAIKETKTAWLALKAVVGTMYASVAIGPLQTRLSEMEAAVGKLA